MPDKLRPDIVSAGARAIQKFFTGKDLTPADFHAMASACWEEMRLHSAGLSEVGEAWLIKYDEAGMPNEVFTDEGACVAAHIRFQQVSIGYNCHLFRKVLEQ